jgi:hypothetical protein
LTGMISVVEQWEAMRIARSGIAHSPPN